ncbi:MAG: hypothetical protein GY896_22955 [Gammaproteobacteria bacterium]|nr:hypothetical protein [Gammaproteobacteria bacterium]
MARNGIEATKEQVLVALEARLNSINPISDNNYFFQPDHLVRVEPPELQYIEGLVFPEGSKTVYFIADEEGLDEETATENEMSEETEVWIAVYRRVPSDKQTVNPFSPDGDYFVKSTERNRIWSDFMRVLSIPDNHLGLGFVENVNITDNRPLWADIPEELQKWVGILFRLSITFIFNRAEPWET